MAGRKALWDELNIKDKLIIIEGWARDGLTDEQMYTNLGVSHDTFYKWKKEKTEFAETLKRGKEVIDRQVENALLKRALGYKYEEVKTTETENGTYKTVTLKEVQPDTTAQIFWLKNRKPEEWRDKQNIEHEGNMNISLEGAVKEWAK